MSRTAAFLLALFLGLTFRPAVYPATNLAPVALYRLAKERNYQVLYNVNLGYADITHASNTVRVFYAMPYLVSSGNIHYLHSAVRFNSKGEVVLPRETAELVLSLLEKKQTAAFPVSTGPVTASSASSSSSSSASSVEAVTPSSSRVSVITRKDGFIPVNAVVLDPGHGGKDPGGLGVNGVKEKEIVLAVMKEVGTLLVRNGKVRVFVTRNNDRFVSLKERTDLANGLMRRDFNPVFISIHGNISLNRKVDGIEVYSLSDRASDDEALTVETMENAGFSRSDVEKTEALSQILGDLLKDGIRSQSSKLSAAIGKEMRRSTGSPIRGIKKANFFVLKYNSMPSVLVEVGFLSSSSESRQLVNRNYQKKLAAGIYNGIISFLNDYNTSRGFTK